MLLHLLAAALYNFTQKNKEELLPIASVYITHSHPFPEVDAFVEDCVYRYGLDLITIEGPMKQALAVYLEKRPNIQGVLVGTRRNDPYAGKNKDY